MIWTRRHALAVVCALVFVGLLSMAQVSVDREARFNGHRVARSSGPFPAATVHHNRQKFTMRWLVDLSYARPADRCVSLSIQGTLAYDSGRYYRPGMAPVWVEYITDTSVRSTTMTARILPVDRRRRCDPTRSAFADGVHAVTDWLDAPLTWNPPGFGFGGASSGWTEIRPAGDDVFRDVNGTADQIGVESFDPGHGQIAMVMIGHGSWYGEGKSGDDVLRLRTRRSAVTLTPPCLTARAVVGIDVRTDPSSRFLADDRAKTPATVCLTPNLN